MKNSIVQIAVLAALISVGAGCASVAVTDDAIIDRTAFALGLDKGGFAIQNRVDDGTTTRYSVKAKSGQEFNCFVGGTFSVMGRMVSEAVCTKKGEIAKNPLLR